MDTSTLAPSAPLTANELAIHDETIAANLVDFNDGTIRTYALRTARIEASTLATSETRYAAIVNATRETLRATPDHCLALLVRGSHHWTGADGKKATAARLTAVIKASDLAVRYADRPECTGAITRLSGIVRPGSGSTLSRAQAQVRAAQDKAACDADNRRKALVTLANDATSAVRDFRSARNAAAKKRALDRINAITHRHGSTGSEALTVAGWR